MKKFMAFIAAGLLFLTCNGVAQAATAGRIQPKQVNVNENVSAGPTQYNMSVTNVYGYANGDINTGTNHLQTFSYSYSEPVNGELTAVLSNLYATGYMAQDWNNQGVFRAIGWYYGGVNSLTVNTLGYWNDIVAVANNTRIIPGRTQAIVGINPDGSEVLLASYAGLGNNGESILRVYKQAYDAYKANNKVSSTTLKSSDVISGYYYKDGEIASYENISLDYKNNDVYTLSVRKTVSPLVLDMAGNGRIEASSGKYLPHDTFDMKNSVIADFYGDGFEVALEWVGANDGLLVASKADGTVDVSCLFGTAGGYESGFEKLALYADKNGVVKDSALNNLAVWQDANRNAIADKGEVRSCRELGITQINAKDNMFVSSFVMNGKTHKMWDWWPSSAELQKLASK